MANLILQIILVFLRRNASPANLSSILRARGIKTSFTSSQYNSTRQLMQRLAARGLVEMTKVRGVREVTFSLTPAGIELANQFESYLTKLDVARDAMEQALGISSGPMPSKNDRIFVTPLVDTPPTSRKVYTCPRCSTAITVDALREQLQRSKGFSCEICHLEQTEMARDFLESLGEPYNIPS